MEWEIQWGMVSIYPEVTRQQTTTRVLVVCECVDDYNRIDGFCYAYPIYFHLSRGAMCDAETYLRRRRAVELDSCFAELLTVRALLRQG